MGLVRGRHSRARTHGLGRGLDEEARHSIPGATRIAGLEIEEPLEARAGAGAVGLALAAVHDDDARRARAEIVGRALHRAAAARSVAARETARGLRRLRLRRHACRPPLRSTTATAPPAARATAARIVLHRSEPRTTRAVPLARGASCKTN